MTRTSRPVAARLAAGALALLAGTALGPAAPAQAADQVDTFAAQARLTPDGALAVTETLTFADAAPAEITQRLALTRPASGSQEYVYDISDVQAQADSGAADVRVTRDDGYAVVAVKTGGAKVVTLSYRAVGAVAARPGGGETFRWRLLQGLSVPVRSFTGVVEPPGQFQDLGCVAGPPAAPLTCRTFQGGTERTDAPTFGDGPLGAGEVVDVALSFPDGVVATNEKVHERWSLDRAFSLAPLPLLAALATLLLGAGALWALHRRAGQDGAFRNPTTIAEFVAADGDRLEFRSRADIRPGQVGTLADERVDPADVTASIIDLAVRGHLRIEQLPAEARNAPIDWTFTRRQEARDEVRPFERVLLDAIAPVDGAPVRVATMAPTVAAAVPQIQSALYDEMVSNGWYGRRPDQVRARWSRLGWAALALAVVATGLLVAFTHLGLLGLVLVALALGLLFVGQEMPARTAQGASLLAGLAHLREDIATVPTDRMPPAREYHELSEVLPYAIVLGGQDRWLTAIVAADDDATPDSTDLPWYHAPADWHLSDFPNAIEAFVTTVTGKLFKRL